MSNIVLCVQNWTKRPKLYKLHKSAVFAYKGRKVCEGVRIGADRGKADKGRNMARCGLFALCFGCWLGGLVCVRLVGLPVVLVVVCRWCVARWRVSAWLLRSVRLGAPWCADGARVRVRSENGANGQRVERVREGRRRGEGGIPIPILRAF